MKSKAVQVAFEKPGFAGFCGGGKPFIYNVS
jgi:hypothetical protein